jgi:hypothetical protein
MIMGLNLVISQNNNVGIDTEFLNKLFCKKVNVDHIIIYRVNDSVFFVGLETVLDVNKKFSHFSIAIRAATTTLIKSNISIVLDKLKRSSLYNESSIMVLKKIINTNDEYNPYFTVLFSNNMKLDNIYLTTNYFLTKSGIMIIEKYDFKKSYTQIKYLYESENGKFVSNSTLIPKIDKVINPKDIDELYNNSSELFIELQSLMVNLFNKNLINKHNSKFDTDIINNNNNKKENKIIEIENVKSFIFENGKLTITVNNGDNL